MHSQGNYTTHVGQAPYAPQSAFPQHPVIAAPHHPPLPHHGSLPPQPQVMQQGHPSFHFRPGILAYQHTIPSVPPQGLSVPGVSSAMSASQPYITRPQPPGPPQGNASTQMSYSYPTEQLRPPWSQTAHQFPPGPPPPPPSAYPLAPSQERTSERGPPHQPSYHTPPAQPPNASDNSSFIRPDTYGPSVPPMRHSYPQSIGILPPPPLAPHPPLPSSSPPVVPPLPPSSPPSDIHSKNDGSYRVQEELQIRNHLILELMSPEKPVEDRNLHQIEGLHSIAVKDDPKVDLGDAVSTRSPADSDMDMEDDITLLDMERGNSLLNNSNDECIAISQDDHMKDQQRDVLDAQTNMLPEVSLDAPVVPAAFKDPIRADESGKERNGQTEQPLEDSSINYENFNKSSEPVDNAETGYGKLSGEVNEGNSFNLLQDYASDDNSEEEAENLLGDASSRRIKDGSSNFGTGKDYNFGPELCTESVAESGKNMLLKSMHESADVMEADKVSARTVKVENISGKYRKGQKFDGHRLKDSSRHLDTDIGSEDANMNQSDIRSNATKSNVDEFGRLIREGISDSDTGGSPHYTRRQARRVRKRSRSQSRSQSPPDRRRRRSPRRKEKRGRSHSWSPKRKSSRSRSPPIRRDIEFTGDKFKREKGQHPVCFAFLRGKCYRGTTCRYSHHEADKSERKRYGRGRQLHRDKSPAIQSPDFNEVNAVPGKEVRQKDSGFPLDSSSLKEANGKDELPVEPVDYTTPIHEKDETYPSLPVADCAVSNLSGYSAHDRTPVNDNFFIPKSLVSDKVHQLINQQGQRIEDSLFSKSSVMETSVSTSAHVPTDKLDLMDDPASQMPSCGTPTTVPYFSEVACQPLKELPSSTASHPSQSTLQLPSISQLPSVSQVVTMPFTQPLIQDYNTLPSASRYHAATENYSAYQAPASYQHFQFSRPLKTSSNSFIQPPLPPPPPLPSHGQFSTNIKTGEHSFPHHVQHSFLPSREGLSTNTSKGDQPIEYPDRSWTGQIQTYSKPRETEQQLHITNNFESSLGGRFGGPHIREDSLSGHPVQGMNPSQSFSQVQPNSLSIQSPSKGMQGSVVGNHLSESTRPYFQQTSFSQHYSAAASGSTQFTGTAKVSSTLSNITPGLLGRIQPSYLREIGGSRISNHFNPYASTFDQPLGSKISSNALTQENDLNINTRYGAPFALSTALGDGSRIGSANIALLGCGLPAERVVSKPGGGQYDPLFDSIDPATYSYTRVDHQQHETVGDSDDVLKLGDSGRVLATEGIKEEGPAVSASNSVEIEEFGETADAEVGAVLTGSPSDPNAAADMNAGEVEIDQVKKSGKKKKSREKSMKLFKISIAAFVKDVLKPSWRQGNMSKEAFKTIVKKTVDKVSGAMKSHRIPRSQTRINQYIDSSRGKLTKLVMGYVDKYVKV